MWQRFSSNALANLLTGTSSIALQLGLTALATRTFDKATFAVWTLALSMASLTPLFAMNLSAVVTRQLVGSMASKSSTPLSLIMASARRIGRGLAALAVAVIMLAALALWKTSPELSTTSIGVFAATVLLLTVGQLWQVGLQATFGWHYAHERNWTVAAILLVVRIAALTSMWVGAHQAGGNLLAVAFLLAAGHWAGVALVRLRFVPPAAASALPDPALKRHISETIELLRWFGVWSVAMAIIQFGLPPLISVLGAAHYNAFYLAYTLNLVLTGIVGALGSAMMVPVTRMGLSADPSAIVRSLTLMPVLISVAILVLLTSLLWSVPFFVDHWSHGVARPSDVSDYLFLLGLQTIARSLSVVFGIVLASRATGVWLVGPTLLEIAVAVFVAMPLGWYFGERVFLLTLAAAGLLTSMALGVVASRLSNLDRTNRVRVIGRFFFIEIASLIAWWILGR